MPKNKNTEINIRTVTPHGARKAILHSMKKKRPIFLWGKPGIGKSDILRQIADEKTNTHLIDVRLALWEPTDIKGIPYFDSVAQKMVWAPPVELPDEEMASQYDSVILFLDEMNSAAPSVQAAAYQLVLNRRVGTYVLPDNVYIVAAGNREGDRGVTYRMPKPLANRFVHVEMQEDFDCWFEWAVDNNINQDVVGFLTFDKSSLCDFDPQSAERAFATPRTWEFVSELIEDEESGEQDHETVMDLVCGAVGEGVALKFMGHRRAAAKLPLPSDILLGKVNKLENIEISAMNTLIIGLCYELRESNEKDSSEVFKEKFERFLTFSMKNFEKEMVVMGVNVAMGRYKLNIDVNESSAFDEFFNEYNKYI